MLSFFFFGRFLEQFFENQFGAAGMFYYIGFYLLGIIASEIPSYLKHKNDYSYNSLGASGAIAAVLFAFIVIAPTESIYIFYILPIPAILFGAFYLYYSYSSAKKQISNINHDAHFYGAVFGIVSILIIEPALFDSFVYQLSHWKF